MARRSACGGGDWPGSPGGQSELACPEPRSSGRKAGEAAGQLRPGGNLATLIDHRSPRPARGGCHAAGLSMSHRRRLCRSGPGPVPQERPAFWEVASPDAVFAFHAVIRTRFPVVTGSVHTAPVAAVGLPAVGLDTDLPVVPTRCCRARQNDRFVRVRPGGRRQSRRSFRRTSCPAGFRVRSPPGRRGAGAGGDRLAADGTGRFSRRRRPWFRRPAQPARLRCPRSCGCGRQRG